MAVTGQTSYVAGLKQRTDLQPPGPENATTVMFVTIAKRLQIQQSEGISRAYEIPKHLEGGMARLKKIFADCKKRLTTPHELCASDEMATMENALPKAISLFSPPAESLKAMADIAEAYPLTDDPNTALYALEFVVYHTPKLLSFKPSLENLHLLKGAVEIIAKDKSKQYGLRPSHSLYDFCDAILAFLENGNKFNESAITASNFLVIEQKKISKKLQSPTFTYDEHKSFSKLAVEAWVALFSEAKAEPSQSVELLSKVGGGGCTFNELDTLLSTLDKLDPSKRAALITEKVVPLLEKRWTGFTSDGAWNAFLSNAARELG